MNKQTFDSIIIGTGQAATPLLAALTGKGEKVAVIEKDQLGGSCVNFGCTPTKAMVGSARRAHVIRNSEYIGFPAPQKPVKFFSVYQFKQEIIRKWRSGVERSIADNEQAELFRGTGSFVDAHTVRVEPREGDDTTLSAEKVFINTGTRAMLPPVKGLDEAPYLTARSLQELKELPEHLLIVGGGYIGVEYAQMFRRFGSKVSVFQLGEQLMPREDEDIAGEMLNIFKLEDIAVHLETSVTRVEQEDGSILVHAEKDGKENVYAGSHLLFAVGRKPNTDMLNLGTAGIETDDRGFITVNDTLQTTAEKVWALGDVKGGPAFTHISYDDYRVVKANLLDGKKATITDRLVPYTVFTDPQLGGIGLNEKVAKKAGVEYETALMPMSSVARAVETGNDIGLMKVLVEPSSGKLLGCSILGMEGGELMSMIQIAMMGGLTYDQLRDGVFAHPTLAEGFNTLFAGI